MSIFLKKDFKVYYEGYFYTVYFLCEGLGVEIAQTKHRCPGCPARLAETRLPDPAHARPRPGPHRSSLEVQKFPGSNRVRLSRFFPEA